MKLLHRRSFSSPSAWFSVRSSRPGIVGDLEPVSWLDAGDQVALAARYTVVDLPAGAFVCRQGRTGNELVFMLQGSADVVRSGAVVGSVHPGDVVGEKSMLGRRVFQDADVVATSPVRVAVVSRGEFGDVVSDRPSFVHKLVATADSRS